MSAGRRGWLIGAGVGVVALGAGVAWQVARRPPTGVRHPVFDARFQRPDGRTLVMAELRGRPLLLNFWATWCPPCIREIPLLDRFARQQRAAGWAVVGLAVDKLEPVREFLLRQPASFEIGLAGPDGVALSRTLGNDGGGLPFTAVLDRQGILHDRHVGELRDGQLQQWVGELSGS